MVMHGQNEITPIFQILSGKHDMIAIEYWSRTFFKLACHIPEEVTCDFSLALLNAIILSFNECRLKIYIDLCFRWLQDEQLQFALVCYVRLDLAYVIKMLCQKKMFNGEPGMVKDFYVF